MYVYLIRDAYGRLYAGVSAKPARRLREHNMGRCPSTRTGLNWKFTHKWKVPDWVTALKLEALLHSMPPDRILETVSETPKLCPELEAMFPPLTTSNIDFHRKLYERC